MENQKHNVQKPNVRPYVRTYIRPYARIRAGDEFVFVLDLDSFSGKK